MQELKRILEDSYYTMAFLFLIQVITAMISFYNRNKFGELRHFYFYPVTALLQTTISFSTIMLLDDHLHARIIAGSVSVFLLAEFIIIYVFAFKNIIATGDRIFLKAIFILFLLYILSMWIFTDAFIRYYRIFVSQSIVLLVPL